MIASTRRSAVAVPVLAWALSGAFAQEDPLTLPEAVRLALERNPEVRVSQELLEELNGKIREVKAGAFPEVTLQGFGLRLRDPSILNSSSFDSLPAEFRNALVPRGSNLFDFSVGFKQTIYSAGKVANGVRLAVEGRQERADNVEATRRRIAFRVFQAFHDYFLAEANARVVRETRDQRLKHLELARNRFRLGVATEIDMLRSEVNLANVEPELIRAENRIRLARSTINNLIVRDLDAPTRVAGRLEHRPWAVPPVEELTRESLQRRPEVLAARHVVSENRIFLTLAEAEKKISVDMETRWGYNVREPKNLFDQDFTRWNVTLNFKLPVYDGGRKAGLVAQAQARLRAAEQSLAQLENSVRLEIRSAADDLQSSAQAIAAARLNVAQAEKVLVMMQSNYQYGAATTLDVVDSQTALTLARNAEILATYDYEIAKARLRLAAGRPVLDEEVGR